MSEISISILILFFPLPLTNNNQGLFPSSKCISNVSTSINLCYLMLVIPSYYHSHNYATFLSYFYSLFFKFVPYTMARAHSLVLSLSLCRFSPYQYFHIVLIVLVVCKNREEIQRISLFLAREIYREWISLIFVYQTESISSSLLKANFIGYRILTWWFFLSVV